MDKYKPIDIELFDVDGLNFRDPKKYSTRILSVSVYEIIRRIEADQIDMSTYFQRQKNLWTITQQSRLIESILIRFPLPVFYFDASNYDKWLIIDGLQRLSSLYNFIVTKNLRLQGLEFTPWLEGKSWDDLSRSEQRQIEESILTIYVIEGFDQLLRFSLFLRINTGGLMFNAQEIRHAIFQGPVSDFIERLSQSEEFIRATGGLISSLRMEDKNLITRFLAFYLFGYEEYKYDLDSYLNHALQESNKFGVEQFDKIEFDFRKAMILAHSIFDTSTFCVNIQRRLINKSLFEVISSSFAQLSENQYQIILQKKETFKHLFENSIKTSRFRNSLTSVTGSKKNVALRHSEFKRIIEKTINA